MTSFVCLVPLCLAMFVGGAIPRSQNPRLPSQAEPAVTFRLPTDMARAGLGIVFLGVAANGQAPTDGCQNIDCVLAAVPMPTLTAERAIEIAEGRLGAAAQTYTLVGINWSKASEFTPRFSDGSTYSLGGDEPNAYSWFLTYVYPDPRRPGVKGVYVVRIKPDGSVGLFIGVRT